MFAFGDVDDVGKDARFQHPLGVAWHDGSVYVADSYNHKIRKVDVATGKVTTWLGTGKAGDSLSPVQFSEPAGLSIAGDFLYIADTNNHRICRANLKTKQVKVIELPDVKPPAPPKTRRVPDMASAQQLPKQTVKLGDAAEVAVELAVPTGFKLNSLAPITWEVFQIEGDQILNPTALEGRDEATADGTVGRFRIPLQETEGTATIAIEMSYGYCDTEKGNICRLASTFWKLPLEVTEDATGDTIKLAFPEN